MLRNRYTDDLTEAGCDEAGRGCLAGPVFAAAVVLPRDFTDPVLDDSKKLTARQREKLRTIIEKEALSWAVEMITPSEIDRVNILNASITAMHQAIARLTVTPQLLLIDGNRFRPYPGIPHHCIIKGDGLYMSIAAASVLAKCYRDDYMDRIHQEHPEYDWIHNKGYGARKHIEAIRAHGITSHHRRSFRMGEQLSLPFNEQFFVDYNLQDTPASLDNLIILHPDNDPARGEK